MNDDRINEVFRTVGKLLYLNELGVAYGSGVKAAIVALQDQTASASGSANPYAELQNFIGPMLNNTRTIVQSLDRVPLVARSGVDTYLRAIAPELGETIGTAPATIATALKEAMVSAAQFVEPSGAFADYFNDNYSVALPSNEVATIPDSLISITIY